MEKNIDSVGQKIIKLMVHFGQIQQIKKEMEKVLKNLFLMSSTKWSIIKKIYQ